MTANNWDFCPQCAINDKKKKLEQIALSTKSYGKVSQEEYQKLLEEANTPIVTKETLAEYYDIGIWENNFEISYKADCNKCGFTFKYSLTQPLELKRGENENNDNSE